MIPTCKIIRGTGKINKDELFSEQARLAKMKSCLPVVETSYKQAQKLLSKSSITLDVRQLKRFSG